MYKLSSGSTLRLPSVKALGSRHNSLTPRLPKEVIYDICSKLIKESFLLLLWSISFPLTCLDFSLLASRCENNWINMPVHVFLGGSSFPIQNLWLFFKHKRILITFYKEETLDRYRTFFFSLVKFLLRW